jgi:hypothetical protein
LGEPGAVGAAATDATTAVAEVLAAAGSEIAAADEEPSEMRSVAVASRKPAAARRITV